MKKGISMDDIVGEALHIKEENSRLCERIAKLESDKTVLVNALEKIAGYPWPWIPGDDYVMANRALEAVKESK